MTLGRFHHQQGIALGPILFILAILAILAAAIAAGSGGFTGSTSDDTAKTFATVIIQDSEQVYNTVQMLMANGCTETQLDFAVNGYIGANPSAPSDGSCGVFNMHGGRLTYIPLISADFCTGGFCKSDPSDGNIIPGVGTGVPQPVWMSYYISQAVCKQINAQLGVTVTASGGINDVGYDGTFPTSNTLNTAYAGLTAACVYGGGGNYLFYRVLFTR
jgi:hypothetical protein